MESRIVDMDKYYRKGVFRHFSEDCRCSVSMTSKLDVSPLVSFSNKSGTKFYINFLYLLSKVLNSREDYRLSYLYQTQQLLCYDRINPCHYVFHEDTETCTVVYSEYNEDYDVFYNSVLKDLEEAKNTREYNLDPVNHPNWFDASYISWLSYEAMNIELPDGHLYLSPIINWGRYTQENGRFLMPLTVRLNHAAADGYLISKVFKLIQEEIDRTCMELQEMIM